MVCNTIYSLSRKRPLSKGVGTDKRHKENEKKQEGVQDKGNRIVVDGEKRRVSDEGDKVKRK